jgi:hypothetical protein
MTSTSRKCRVSVAIVAVAALGGLTPPLMAQGDRGNDNFFLRVAPYYWASNLGGSVTLGFPEVEQTADGFHVPVGDTILLGSWALRVEAGKGRWRVIGGLSRASIANNAVFVNVSDPADSVTGAYDLTWVTGEAFLSVQLGPFAQRHAAELYAGLRYQHWGETITPAGSSPLEFPESWIDPVIGGRAFMEMGRRWWAQFNSDLGGFGVGSNITWTMGGELGFRVIKALDLTMRYNYMEVEYDNGKSGAETFIWENGVAQGWFFGAVIKL